jgi:hypothetical protein
MAIGPAVVTGAWGAGPVTGSQGTQLIAAHQWAIERCYVSVNANNATAYAQADGVSFNPTVVIQNSFRDGQTITALQACCVSSGLDNGVQVGAGACVVTAGTVVCHILVADEATEKGNGAWAAAATWTRDMVFCVEYARLIA